MGKFAVDLAIQKAKEAGIGMVTVRGLSFFLSFSNCNVSHIGLLHNVIPFSTVFRKNYFASPSQGPTISGLLVGMPSELWSMD